MKIVAKGEEGRNAKHFSSDKRGIQSLFSVFGQGTISSSQTVDLLSTDIVSKYNYIFPILHFMKNFGKATIIRDCAQPKPAPIRRKHVQLRAPHPDVVVRAAIVLADGKPPGEADHVIC